MKKVRIKFTCSKIKSAEGGKEVTLTGIDSDDLFRLGSEYFVDISSENISTQSGDTVPPGTPPPGKDPDK